MTKLIATYIITTFIATWSFWTLLPAEYLDFGMFFPTIVALFFVYYKKLKFLYIFKIGSLKNIALGVMIPLMAFFLVVFFYKIFALAEVGLSEDVLSYNEGSALRAWKNYIIYALPSILAFNLLFALGEEIGWRGFLLQRVIETKRFTFIQRALFVGIIWGVWHIPMYIIYGTELTSIVIFLVNVCLISVILTWLYEKQNIIWPVVCVHGVHNVLFNTILPSIILKQTGRDILLGEEGLILTLSYLLIFIGGSLLNNKFGGK